MNTQQDAPVDIATLFVARSANSVSLTKIVAMVLVVEMENAPFCKNNCD